MLKFRINYNLCHIYCYENKVLLIFTQMLTEVWAFLEFCSLGLYF